ncbi:MAG TPA: ABC transporter substrate-binding protein, partial [Phototrophicaceae bacterium]|nr:ABC transporter substrate-binding protein [Phototrophicaceae bacterium]
MLCLLFMLVSSACAPVTASNTSEVSGKRIVYGLTLSPSGFDPHRNESAELGIAMRQVYDTLIYRNPTDGGFVPGLATDWAVSDDRLTYTFNLRQDVKFHDGTPFNALAVATNLDR